jgi:hypothetical protein
VNLYVLDVEWFTDLGFVVVATRETQKFDVYHLTICDAKTYLYDRYPLNILNNPNLYS